MLFVNGKMLADHGVVFCMIKGGSASGMYNATSIFREVTWKDGIFTLLSTWVNHFESAGRSQIPSNNFLKEVASKVQELECGLFGESDEVPDVPFVCRRGGTCSETPKTKTYGWP